MIPAVPYRGETRVLDDATRREASGSFVRLNRGTTHFESAGPEQAQPVVLVHGFSVPLYIWEPTFRTLATAGFRVVRYDLFGRGYSDRPHVAYDISLFVEQLRELVDALGLARVDLVGLSMGGPIVAAFTAAFPDEVRRVALIDPSGTKSIDLGMLYRLAVLPGVGDLLFRLAGSQAMLSSIAKDFFDPRLVDEFRERYRTQMDFRGFRMAILSTVRHKMLGSHADSYAILGRLGKPVLLIWGERDKTVPFQQSQLLRTLIPQAEFLPIRDCGHIPHYERPDAVHPRLISFLS